MSKSFFFIGFTKPAEDGHKRVTKFQNGVAMGGTQEEHEKMQDSLAKFDSKVSKAITKHGDKLSQQHINDIMNEMK